MINGYYADLRFGSSPETEGPRGKEDNEKRTLNRSEDSREKKILRLFFAARRATCSVLIDLDYRLGGRVFEPINKYAKKENSTSRDARLRLSRRLVRRSFLDPWPFSHRSNENRRSRVRGFALGIRARRSDYLGKIVGGLGDWNIEKFCDTKDGDFGSLALLGCIVAVSLRSMSSLVGCSSAHCLLAACTISQK